MSEENEFSMYKNIVNNYFRTETFEKAKDYCVRDMLNLQNKYFNEHELRKQLLFQVEKLQKENKKYIDIFNSTEKIMNGQERTKDKLLKENVELQKENKELKEDSISKDIIKAKIEELEKNVKDFEEYWKKDPRKFKKEVCVDYYKLEVLRELLGE